MNISGISSTQSFQSDSVSGNRAQNQLSSDQKDYVSSILENYDSDSLSQEDAIEIASAFAEAGINPSRDLANTMSESGFSAHEVGELAGVAGASGMPPPPPGEMPPPPKDESDEIQSISNTLEVLLNLQSDESSISEEEEEFIASLLSNYDSDNISQEDATQIDSALKDAGIMPSSQLAEVMSASGFDAREIGDLAQSERPPQASSYESVSDYTSRIMSLTEDSKQLVKELFDAYSPQNTTLTAQESSAIVANSLSQILGDSNNYKNTSYYA
jgi:hypothetical protein